MSAGIERDTLRTVGGTLLLFTGLVGFTEATLRSFAPLFGLFGGMLVHEMADDLYDLPEGTNWTVYGLGIVFAGVIFVFNHGVRAGLLLAAAGAWFVLDGATEIRYGRVRTTHEFASGAEDEAMLRILILNRVHRALRRSDRPQTVERLAESCDLTESRVESTLDYLEHRDQVTSTENGYRARPQRWGKATPVARVVGWVPRRVVRPLSRMRRRT